MNIVSHFPRRRSFQSNAITLALAGALMGAGCGGDFEARTELTSYRILGIETSPPETTPDGQVEVQVHDYLPDDADSSYRWSLCLHTLGALVDYECFDTDLERELGTASAFTLDLGPDGLNWGKVLEDAGSLPGADGNPLNLEEGVDIWLKLRSDPDCENCNPINAVKRLRVRAPVSGDDVTNENPKINQLEVVGPRTPGSSLQLVLTTDEPQSYTRQLTSEQRQEEYLYTWYSSLGETDPGISFGDERETELTVPNDAEPGDSFVIAVAVRDGRGGFAIQWQDVVIE